MNYLMKCGHTSYATCNGKPACVICDCTEIEREVYDTEGLEGRKAKCSLCGQIVDSNWGLAFFEYRPDREYDSYYNGCRGWD